MRTRQLEVYCSSQKLQPLAHPALLRSLFKPTWQAALASRVEDELRKRRRCWLGLGRKRRRCRHHPQDGKRLYKSKPTCANRRGCRRSQKCGHCVHWRQPPERSFGPSPAQTCQILYIIQPQLLANLHTCCGAVRAASPALPSSGPSPARQAIIYTYISPPQLPATNVDDAGGGAAAFRSAATVCTGGSHPSAPPAPALPRHAR